MKRQAPMDAFLARQPKQTAAAAKRPRSLRVDCAAGDAQQPDAPPAGGDLLSPRSASKPRPRRRQSGAAPAAPDAARPQSDQAAGAAGASGSSEAAAAGSGAAAASGSAASSSAAGGGKSAFGTLMAAARSERQAAKAAREQQRSPAELQLLASRNQEAVAAALAEARLLQQPPKLASLLVEPSWQQVLGAEFGKPYMAELQAFLQAEWARGSVYPPQDCIFRAFNSVPFDQVRVVILGQDPYINEREAMGLSFSVPPGVRVPPSLGNIYKELATDVGARVPNHGCLEKWCRQGVLLLNAALTVRAKASNSHAGKGWESFTSAALTALAQQRTGLVFLLWGKFAQDRCAKLELRRHHVLKSVHPSPLSAHRGFLGCKHFSATNRLLQSAGLPAIDWQIEDV